MYVSEFLLLKVHYHIIANVWTVQNFAIQFSVELTLIKDKIGEVLILKKNINQFICRILLEFIFHKKKT